MPNIHYFPYFGPNRRSDRAVVEITLNYLAGEELNVPVLAHETGELLRTAGILDPDEAFPAQALPEDSTGAHASLLAQTALLLQRKTGHRVDFFDVWRDEKNSICLALVEHEHCDVGMTAVKLAIEVIKGQGEVIGSWRAFNYFARQRLLPLETEAIIAAAHRRGIPCIHHERHPLTRSSTENRCARRNGLLQLGHGAHGRIVDGTFPADRADEQLWALLRNPSQRRAVMSRIKLPLGREDITGNSLGKRHRLLAINDRFWLPAENEAGVSPGLDAIDECIVQAASRLHQEFGRAPMLLHIHAADITRPLSEPEGIADFDLAPRLDELLGPDAMEQAVEALLDWLFPQGTQAGIPVVAITGTNGKTTTTTMVAHIMRHAGLMPGMATTNGVYIGGEQVSEGDFGSRDGHLQVLTSPEVNAAALETHHRAIMIRGFAFDTCDAAICLNVTEDHLGEATGLASVSDMARVKRALVERASGMAVLNADDEHCLAMLEHVSAERTGLVSLHLGTDELQDLAAGRKAVFCLLQAIQGQEWLTIVDGGEHRPVIAVGRIPATFGGAARFMISNAMHAALAAYAVGIDTVQIAAALTSFMTSPEATPGRLNVFDGLPFRVIADFAHNPDGMRRLAEFADGLSADGRKIVAFAGIVGRPAGMHRNVARALAGHFDFYFCKEYTPREGFPEDRLAPRLREVLVESGVAENQITLQGSGREAVFEIFDACRPGDVLFLLLGHVEYPQLRGWMGEYMNLREL